MKSNSIHSNRITIASLLVALGIIYGDIGTSPLYVLKAIVGEKQIDEVLVLGGSPVFFDINVANHGKIYMAYFKSG